jgi:endogenous inhibitor of DNA gyrase (YacG/DUF329 family)
MSMPTRTETVECAYCPTKFVKPTSQRKRFCSDKCKRDFTAEAYQIGARMLDERKASNAAAHSK